MTDKWLDADWDMYAMGTLEQGTQREMQAHLQTGCSSCLASYREAISTMTSLASTSPVVEPSPGIAGKLLARIAERDAKVLSMPRFQVPSKESGSSGRGTSTRRAVPWLPWAVAAGFALLALWLGIRPNRNAPGTPSASTPQQSQPASPVAQAPSASSTTPPVPTMLPATEAAAAELRQQQVELKKQLAQAEVDRDRALAQASESSRALAEAVAERGTLQTQLAAAQEQARLANTARESRDADARVEAQNREQLRNQIQEVTRQLDKANATIASLHNVTAHDSEILAFLRSGPTRQIDLKRIDAGAGEATGVAYVAPGRGLLLLARGLPQLQPGKCYQLWSIHKSGTAVESVGLLQTDASGTGYLFARDSRDLAQLSGLAITDEPSGGSVSARGRKLLFGVLN